MVKGNILGSLHAMHKRSDAFEFFIVCFENPHYMCIAILVKFVAPNSTCGRPLVEGMHERSVVFHYFSLCSQSHLSPFNSVGIMGKRMMGSAFTSWL